MHSGVAWTMFLIKCTLAMSDCTKSYSIKCATWSNYWKNKLFLKGFKSISKNKTKQNKTKQNKNKNKNKNKNQKQNKTKNKQNKQNKQKQKQINTHTHTPTHPPHTKAQKQ